MKVREKTRATLQETARQTVTEGLSEAPHLVTEDLPMSTLAGFDTQSAALLLNELCRSFPAKKGKRTLAVDHLNLRVERGEIFGVLGPNGSGKTTTVNMISGLLPPTSGSIFILGMDMRRDSRRIRRVLGAVPQETAVYEELSAQANMKFHAELYGIPRGERDQRIDELFDLVQLRDRRDSRVSTFSGGMKRRLAIARALLHRPDILYLDEPTLGVDVQSKRAIWDYVLRLRDQGKTVIITTNYMEEAQVLCDRLAILDHGKLIALDTPANLKDRYGANVLEVDLADRGEELQGIVIALEGVTESVLTGNHLTITFQGSRAVLPQIITSLAACTSIEGLTVREPHLDEIFLHLTGSGLRD